MAYATILTIARLKYTYDHPLSLNFYETAAKVNEQAARSGHLIKFISEDGVHLPLDTIKDDLAYSALTLSVWKDVGAMYRFTFSSEHLQALRKRKHWLRENVLKLPDYVIWWTEKEEDLSWEEGIKRYTHLERVGPSPFAFNFLKVFDAMGEVLPSNEWKNGGS